MDFGSPLIRQLGESTKLCHHISLPHYEPTSRGLGRASRHRVDELVFEACRFTGHEDCVNPPSPDPQDTGLVAWFTLGGTFSQTRGALLAERT